MNTNIRWTNLTPNNFVKFYAKKGVKTSSFIIKQLLKNKGFGKRKLSKKGTIKDVANRDSQFKYITVKKKEFKEKNLPILSISSFILSEKGVTYDSTISITNFIVLNKEKTLQEFYTFKNGKYEGVKSLFNDVYFNGEGFSSSYDSSKTFSKNEYNSIMYNSLQELQKHNFELLFAVKYFRNAIWFIENRKVYLLDTKELIIYDPDEYIKQKCSINTIRNLSKGIIDKYCD